MQVLVYEVHVWILSRFTFSCTQQILHLHFILSKVVHIVCHCRLSVQAREAASQLHALTQLINQVGWYTVYERREELEQEEGRLRGISIH